MQEMAIRVRLLRKRLGIKTQALLAEMLGVTQPTVSRWERGEDEPQNENLSNLAKLAGIPVEEFAGYSSMTPTNVKKVKVIGKVQAGLWVDAVEWHLNDQYEVSWSPDGIWDGYPKFGLRVTGNSMNKLYPDGAVVICVKFYDVGERDPRDGERVVVYRHQAGSDLFEATLKEFIVQDGKGWLWPRSDDPAFQTPLPYLPSPEREGDWTEVHALVIGSYQPESARP